jgi:CrcB protein
VDEADADQITARVLALISIGGAIGAGARYMFFRAAPVHDGSFPTPTLCVNVLGAFLLGVVLVRLRARSWARPFLAVGMLGGFTTLSTFAVETAELARHDHWGTAALYGVATATAIAAAALGLVLGGWRPWRVVPSEGES